MLGPTIGSEQHLNTTVGAGHTFAFSGVLDAGYTLTALGGRPSSLQGALIAVSAQATNDGTIDLLGGAGNAGIPGATGAELKVTGTLTNNGMIDLSGGSYGRPATVPGTGARLIDQGVVLNAGTILIEAASTGAYPNTASGTGAVLMDSSGLSNTGLLSIQGGMGAAGGGAAGGTVIVLGFLTDTGSLIVGAGTYANGSAGLGALMKISPDGILINTGQLTVNGGLAALGGTVRDGGLLTNTGEIYIAGGKDSRYEEAPKAIGKGGFLHILPRASLNNSGTISVAGGGLGDGGTLEDTGTLTNTGTLFAGGGGAGYFYGGLGAALEVTGVLTNQGVLDVGGGYVFYGQDSVSTGSGATLTDAGSLTNAGSLLVYGGTSFSSGNAGVIIDTGTLTNTGTITLLNGERIYYGSQAAGAAFDVVGELTNSGLISVYGGGDRAVFEAAGMGATLSDTGVLVNAGTIIALGANVASSYSGFGGSVIDSSTLVNSGMIMLDAGFNGGVSGTLSVTAGASLTNSGSIGGGGTLVNDGTIISTAGPTGSLLMASFVNNGLVQLATDSSFVVKSDVTASTGARGVFDVGQQSTLSLYRPVTASQQVAFTGSLSTLSLGDASDFAGIIAGLQPQTTIDFLNLDVTSATPVGTTLEIGVAGGGSLNLALAAPLGSDITLKLVSDGHQGTDLNFDQG